MGTAFGFGWEETERCGGTPRVRARSLLVALMIAIGVAGCSDDPAPERESQAQTLSETQPDKPATHELKWLRLTDGIAPEQWLASREAGRDLGLYEGPVLDMGQVLHVATERFRDQPRMIANRAVQLEEMLREKGIAERAPRLIVTLSQVPGVQRSVESFAALTQQYYNLRLEGLGQGAAVEALKKQLGPSAPETNEP